MKSHCPARCGICPDSHEAFNGRYCRRLEMKVEYRLFPPCEERDNTKGRPTADL